MDLDFTKLRKIRKFAIRQLPHATLILHVGKTVAGVT